MDSLLYICLVISSLKACEAVMCYWCSGVGDDRDCEQHPYAVQTGPVFLNCRAHFCLSVKVLDADTGAVKSFARLCDNVPRDNVCIQDSKLMTCYESCTDDLCNNGNPDPKYMPITNYASVAPKEHKKEEDEEENGLKGNIFGEYSSNKEVSPFRRNKSHQKTLENARERLLSNAFRRGSGLRKAVNKVKVNEQTTLPKSKHTQQRVIQVSVSPTTATVDYVTDTNRATVKSSLTTAVANRTTTKSSARPTTRTTTKSSTRLRPTSPFLTTPITTLSLLESSHDIPLNPSIMDTSGLTTSPETFVTTANPKIYKISKFNDVQYKASEEVDTDYQPRKSSQYTFGASSGITIWPTPKPNQSKSSTRITFKTSARTSKISPTAKITTFKADLSTRRATLRKTKTTMKPSPNNGINTDTLNNTILSDFSHYSNKPQPSPSSLILPNNVANMEKPVTAINEDSYGELHGLEDVEEAENTFAFNSHPRNQNSLNHKHHHRKPNLHKKVESHNGIVIWPMKETTREEEVISNSILVEDKEESMIEPYNVNNTSIHPTGRIKTQNSVKTKSSKPIINKTTPRGLINSITPADVHQTTPFTTPINTMIKKSTFSLVSSKYFKSPFRKNNTTKRPLISKDLIIARSKKFDSKKLTTGSSAFLTTSTVQPDKTKVTPSVIWDRSTRQYASKLSEVWNEVKTTVIINKPRNLPIPAEYPSFFAEDELIEYPAFENEIGELKDSTEDLMQVAGYQDEDGDTTSSASRVSVIFTVTIFSVILTCTT